jgi:zinc transporter, ZIP family
MESRRQSEGCPILRNEPGRWATPYSFPEQEGRLVQLQSVVDWFRVLDPLWQATLAGCFTWGVTALGASGVLLRRSFPRSLLDAMLGFAAGVMIAASFWSLLAPSIRMAEAQGNPGWLPAAVGFSLGTAFLWATSQMLPQLSRLLGKSGELSKRSERTSLLVLAVTLHNIPEGLAIGILFGAAATATGGTDPVVFGTAVALTLGLGLQNFPEGVVVAMPLRQAGVGPFRCFWYGQLSAVVEPMAAALGAVAVLTVRPLLPFALAFAAGAMIYVVVEQLIPESQARGRKALATVATAFGFLMMMILDGALR